MNHSKGKNALWVGCVFYAMLVIVGWIAFATRFDRVKWGFPYLYYWDEPQTASTALRMLKTGNFNPYFYNYGTLPICINLLIYLSQKCSLGDGHVSLDKFSVNPNLYVIDEKLLAPLRLSCNEIKK
jgi:hypothetical protein